LQKWAFQIIFLFAALELLRIPFLDEEIGSYFYLYADSS